MPAYNEMYLALFRATEKAANILIEAQQKMRGTLHLRIGYGAKARYNQK